MTDEETTTAGDPPSYEEATGDVDTGDAGDTETPGAAEEAADEEGTLPPGDTPQQQREAYKALGYKTQVVDDTWYAISKKWYDEWVTYTAYNTKDEDIDGGLESLHLREDVNRPEAIDNSDLVDETNPSALKRAIEEHTTHEWVHEDQWRLLTGWYGGGPAFPRTICERGSSWMKEKYILAWPVFLKFAPPNETLNGPDESKAEEKQYTPDTKIADILDEYDGEEGSSTFQKTHLWVKFSILKDIYKLPKTKKGVEVTAEDLADEDGDRYVEVPDDIVSNTKLEDLPDLGTCTIIVVRRNEDDSWPMGKGDDDWQKFQVGDFVDGRDNQSKWYESYVRMVGKEGTTYEGKLIVHFIGWAAKWDEAVDIETRVAKRSTHTTGPHRPQPKKSRSNYSSGYSSWSYYSHESGPPSQRGVVGLRNLGNTCFMNSTLQCMAQTPRLTPYFISGDFQHDINKDNPLGWKGKVAEAWAKLMSDMHGDKFSTVAPREFKSAIGEVAPRFMGYSQQDSQELLSFLLDGLHEDLNTVKKKPATEAVESGGRPDSVVALESWKTYLLRNQSIIVDLMQGQYKSRVECPDCPRISVTFDPYMYLSVPLPSGKYKDLEFTWMGIPGSGDKPTVHGIKVAKYADISTVKKNIAAKFGIDKDDIFVCDVWKSKIHRDFKSRDSVQDINPKSDDIFVYYAPKPAAPEATDAGTETTDAADAVDAESTATPEDTEAGAPATVGDGSLSEDDEPQNGSQTAVPTAPPFKTFVVLSQMRMQIRSTYYHKTVREEDTPVGVPMLITLPTDRPVTCREMRAMLFNVIKSFLTDQELTVESEELPFEFRYTCGYTSGGVIDDSDDEVPLDERNLKFVLHFNDATALDVSAADPAKRERDESAPLADQSGYGRRREKAVSLHDCLAAFAEEETLEESEAWYCSDCKDFKCARKKIDLWSTPDVLIIHLKRFAYTRVWRDRINTLVDFPLEGLDLSEWCIDPTHKGDAIYDCYGISNHMGGMGGGHYTAYTKNLWDDKWYHLDDSRTSPVREPASMISSSAYVLYYKRRELRGSKHRASRVEIPSASAISG